VSLIIVRVSVIWHCLSLVFVALAVGCGGFAETKRDAELVAEDYFAAAVGDPEEITRLYDDEFYRATPHNQWMKSYAEVHNRLGRPMTHSLKSWRVDNTIGSDGRFVTLIYKVNYEHGSGIETLRVFVPSGTHRGSIRGHKFGSDEPVK
jgi:hypothetical protein